MDEYGNVLALMFKGANGNCAGRGRVPTLLPDPLTIPALLMHHNKFGSCFLKAFSYLVFHYKKPFKKMLTNRENEVHAHGEGQTEEKAEDTAKHQGYRQWR